MPFDPTLIESGGAASDRPLADKAVEKTLIEPRNEGGTDERTLLEAQPPPTPGGGVGLNLVPGAQFLEYRLVEPIKVASGEAELWVADGGGRRVVLKFYRWGLHPKAGLSEKLSKISKGHIVEVYGRGTSPDGRDYEILEFIRHGTLADFGKGGLPEIKVREVLRELTDAVAALHAENILHRDLKPANVLVRTIEPLNLVLTDFGISSVMDISLHVTSVNRTAAYSAPEAMTGVVSKASDWWSVGVIVMEMFQGAQPFAGLDERAINFALVMRGITVPKEIPTEWQSLLKGLLTRDHAKRWNEIQIGQWLDGKTNIPLYYNEATAVPVARIRKNRPCQFLKTDYFEPADLALAMAEQWDEAAKRFERGIISDWIKKEVQNADLASLLIDVQEDTSLNTDQKLSVALLAMNDQLPLSWRGEVVNQDWITTHPPIGIQFLKSDLSTWLKRLRQETWLEELKNRYFDLKRQVNRVCSEEAILRAALATDALLMQSGRKAQQDYYSSSDSQLNELLSKRQLTPVEAAILALAPPTLFVWRGVKEMSEFAKTLADITQFSFPTTRALVEQRFDPLRCETAKLEAEFARVFDAIPIPLELIKSAEVKANQADAVLRALLAERNDAAKAVSNILPQQLGTGQLRSVQQTIKQIKARFADIDCVAIETAIIEWEAFYKNPSVDVERLKNDLHKLTTTGGKDLQYSEIIGLDERLTLLRTEITQKQQTLSETYQGTEFNELAAPIVASLCDRVRQLELQLQMIRMQTKQQMKQHGKKRVDNIATGIFWIFVGACGLSTGIWMMSSGEVWDTANMQLGVGGLGLIFLGLGGWGVIAGINYLRLNRKLAISPESSSVTPTVPTTVVGDDEPDSGKKDANEIITPIRGIDFLELEKSEAQWASFSGDFDTALKRIRQEIADLKPLSEWFVLWKLWRFLRKANLLSADVERMHQDLCCHRAALEQDYYRGTPFYTFANARCDCAQLQLRLNRDEIDCYKCLNVVRLTTTLVNAVVIVFVFLLLLNKSALVTNSVVRSIKSVLSSRKQFGYGILLLLAYSCWHLDQWLVVLMLRLAAKRGNAEAPWLLAEMYASGIMVEKSEARELWWCRKAAEAEHPNARFHLGIMYRDGKQVQRDFAAAARWFRAAADQGFAPAQHNLGVMYSEGEVVSQDSSEAMKWFFAAARQGLAVAQFAVGAGYANGKGDATAVEAANWFRKAAEQGLAEAQFNLAMMYYNGGGIKQDHTEALKWFRKAADQGHVNALEFVKTLQRL